jgi:hypothetical protein
VQLSARTGRPFHESLDAERMRYAGRQTPLLQATTGHDKTGRIISEGTLRGQPRVS